MSTRTTVTREYLVRRGSIGIEYTGLAEALGDMASYPDGVLEYRTVRTVEAASGYLPVVDIDAEQEYYG